ncbi:winged helix-turn-helix domain-containing protein [Enterobacter quasiroggenkampii]|uniref:winged helix-turn-helix domain-containing protein n=1 Tax=Enterobacter quasiroggenkampii TaxID=2497436 RepID=UPI0021D20EA5|nr:winged helix-turn-helix domain-containing protein [Enterobacter quasiroggenkampii]MCU6349108.1 winged helix-turn-helix domain-containing protein [Enterobacter quasiroggenkampii]
MFDRGSVNDLEPTLYKIEGSVHFYPNENTLRNLKNGQTVTLPSAASECLRVLIEAQGSVVSRDEIKELVWGKRGIVVSNNTFYQSMLNLRRGLENVGISNRIISTHYGKGVKIDDGIEIKLVNVALNDSVSSLIEAEKNIITYPVSSTVHDKNFQTNIAEKRGGSRLKKERVCLVLIVNLILCFLCAVMLYAKCSFSREGYFSKYTKTNIQVKNCDIYTDPTLLDETLLRELLKTNPPDCEEGERIYFSSVYPIQRTSVIRCAGNFLPGEECESDFYLE